MQRLPSYPLFSVDDGHERITRMNDFPYRVLQNIASFLSIEDRFQLAGTCIQINDAVDSDDVWYSSIDRISSCTQRIEAALPHDVKETPEEHQQQLDKLYRLIRSKLPKSYRLSCEGFQRFRTMAVAYMMPRTVAFLAHGGHKKLRFFKDVLAGNFDFDPVMAMPKEVKDEIQDVYGPRDMKNMAKLKKIPKDLVRCCLPTNRYAHEVMFAIESLAEAKMSVVIAAIGNGFSAIGYFYFAFVNGAMYLSLKFLNSRSEYWREKFSTTIQETTRGKVFMQIFIKFPQHPPDPTGAVFRPAVAATTRSSNFASTSSSLLMSEHCGAAALAQAAHLVVGAAATVAAQEGSASGSGSGSGAAANLLQSMGLPASDVSTWIGCAACTGVISSYMGGRCPSLHQIPSRLAVRYNLILKILYDGLRSSLQRNIDAFIFFWMFRASTIPASLSEAIASVRRFVTDNKVSNLSRLLYNVTVGKLIDKVVPGVVWRIRDRVGGGTNEFITNRIMLPVSRFAERFISTPFSKARAVLFGNMSGAAIGSFAASTFLSTAVQVAIESNRDSFQRTVKAQHYNQNATMASHAAFAISLSLLRWRLYCGGASFWKVTAIEAAVRIGVSMSEVIFARMTYKKPRTHVKEVFGNQEDD